MEFKGTKGELRITETPRFSDENNEYNGEFSIRNEDNEVFAQVHAYSFYKITIERAEANAHLIAAAPELLEALRVCVARLRNEIHAPHAINDAQAAINKALNK